MKFSRIPRNPDSKTLRLFALLSILAIGGAGLFRLAVDGPTPVAWVLIAGGFGIGLTGLIHPRAVRAVFVGALIATFPIGWVVSRLLLSGVYYGLISVAALLFRVTGRDRLRLRNTSSHTCWTKTAEAASSADYLRQY